MATRFTVCRHGWGSTGTAWAVIDGKNVVGLPIRQGWDESLAVALFAREQDADEYALILNNGKVI